MTLELAKPSLYSETVWEARKTRLTTERRTIDWLVLRNRLATTESRNRKRLDERVQTLSKRGGFRVGPGLRDRVIYRELFPFGLTIADLSASVRPVAVSLSHVAARQELRAIMQALGLEIEPAPVAAPAFGRTVPVAETVAKIEAVTVADVRRAAARIFRGRPTLAAMGPTEHVPGLAAITDKLAA